MFPAAIQHWTSGTLSSSPGASVHCAHCTYYAEVIRICSPIVSSCELFYQPCHQLDFSGTKYPAQCWWWAGGGQRTAAVKSCNLDINHISNSDSGRGGAASLHAAAAHTAAEIRISSE